ncbi:MAG TPA: energy-coupling factor ABC transporter ATP-binding protein [Negativicutes bacterium]|nr:energy-coupling factor ABC transporter ATP-binding protein [Negativicutes bacterium]
MSLVPILEAKNVCFNYQTGKPVLKELNISIPAGARVAIVGPNGAGKSTLFLHFNAILQPTSGALFYQGVAYDYSRKSVSRLRQKIGMVFQDQDMQLFAPTVLDDVLFGPMNMGLSLAEAERAARAAVETVEMSEYLEEPVHFLSPGQKKRVALAGVLAMEPEVLVMDEPTAGLDYAGSLNLCGVMNRLHKSGKTLVVSTHDMDWVMEWADLVVAMYDGQVSACGTPSEVLLRDDHAELGFARPTGYGSSRGCGQ